MTRCFSETAGCLLCWPSNLKNFLSHRKKYAPKRKRFHCKVKANHQKKGESK
ncbi:hypothetical protein CHCC20341_2715 [Bacillus licheniformis]|uniref:Uncharacterized protein n=1 Tax=Bacillus licheniformis TaxID=1402 RepID=A0A8B5YCD8_BACLI|nr:hypothetical protein B4164_4175 [Bacillus licheniformis]TWK62346.1 hypothetical protein CHCC20344_0553 [Bacillus licheniformis]TWK75180.1 hypothetical protein CHCC20341_2715 [Bacillus licheniformis]TWL27566.1 hypothetical protein CHCC16736_2887 [Bacillus licheniformis]TWL27911.1 hypothetical protein CHCC15546_2252 [Bacillus licheniformis]